MSRPVGRATRGTTNTNRLRRVDRWIAASRALRNADDPLVVDLGYGASAVTVFELATRLRKVRDDVQVIGVEIDSERVESAAVQLFAVRRGLTPFAANLPVSFIRGGFELPTPGERKAAIIRAMNVLRQYDESDVPAAWEQMASRLLPGGTIVEGTCDERGRVASWLALDAAGAPQTFTISLRLAGLERPGIVAERLPKALIHHNVPGESVHALLRDLDTAWIRAADLATFGPTQRFLRCVGVLKAQGWPILAGTSRWRLGELTVPWSAVAPQRCQRGHDGTIE